MAPSWISLPLAWQLQDIQAGLTVMMCLLSAAAIWCFIRCCWQFGTHKIRNQGSTPLSSLLTMNTLGEVFDAIMLLRLRILSRRNLLLLTQCLLVFVFTTTTMLSGPIVRLSTRMGTRTKIIQAPVYPAMKEFDIIAYRSTYWTQISDSLNNASYPYDRLLDFLPNVDVNWTYVPEQWTTTWSLKCDSVPRTSIDLTSTGHCSGKTVPASVPTIYEGMPGLYSILNMSEFEVSGYDWSGFWVTNRNPIQDMLMFLYGHNVLDKDPETGIVYGINFSLASVHLHNLNKNLTTPNDCKYAAGLIGSTSYTRVDCALHRARQVPDEKLVPYPDSIDMSIIAKQINVNFQGRFMLEAATNVSITEITPEDIIRFYQVFMISKDTQYRQAVARPLTVIQKVPQISAVFLGLILLLIALMILTASSWCLFTFRHTEIDELPLTKLDWLLHAIDLDDLPNRTSRSPIMQRGFAEHGRPELMPRTDTDLSSEERFESALYVKDFSRSSILPLNNARSPGMRFHSLHHIGNPSQTSYESIGSNLDDDSTLADSSAIPLRECGRTRTIPMHEYCNLRG